MKIFSLKTMLCIAFGALLSPLYAQEKIILVNEGTWQSDNGRLTYFEDGEIISNSWFRDVNGYKLGDTPNDIIQVRPNLIALAINWSNIIQFIDATGHAVAATENVPNNRRLATDGNYVYVTSYAHECSTASGLKTFTKGFVAKIDANTFSVIDAVEVGYEPEGIACYKGKLFVANSGGYAFQENHDYEKTVSIIDASTMKVERTIDTGQPNLYGTMSQAGPYLCINSPGDYYEIQAATIIFDCDAALTGKPDEDCFVKLDNASTYNCKNMEDGFYAIGSVYSYLTGGYEFNYITIDPGEVMQTNGAVGVTESLPGTVMQDIMKMEMPYGLYVNPYTGYIYATDAAGFVEGGKMYQWSPEGKFINEYSVYINASRFLALNPQGESGVGDVQIDEIDEDLIYNLQGIRITNPQQGEIYIKNRKKVVNI